jgi:hypothetical protein
MLSVANKLIMLSVTMLNVVILTVLAPELMLGVRKRIRNGITLLKKMCFADVSVE